MNKEAFRRKSQLEFVASDQDLTVGEEALLPMSLEALQNTNQSSEYVLESYDAGLTGVVYHICIAGKHYNLKLKRKESLVQNTDGQTSFLNEVQRRRDFQLLKNNPNTKEKFGHVVSTIYASYRKGIILSDWIAGQLLDEFNEAILNQIFTTVVNFELHGFIEWDLCPGNILYDGKSIHLFDFGYCYQFDPLTEYNSSGLMAPMYHSVERLETRHFFGHLLQKEDVWTLREILSLFELEKRLALQAYEYKYKVLLKAGATDTVLNWVESFINRWRLGVSSPTALEDLYLVESFRSHLLDINDDLSGKTCTPMTLKRINKIKDILSNQFEVLEKLDGFLFEDKNKTKAQLIERTAKQQQDALNYQIVI